jgi:hypothetical protein
VPTSSLENGYFVTSFIPMELSLDRKRDGLFVVSPRNTASTTMKCLAPSSRPAPFASFFHLRSLLNVPSINWMSKTLFSTVPSLKLFSVNSPLASRIPPIHLSFAFSRNCYTVKIGSPSLVHPFCNFCQIDRLHC